MQNPDHHPDRVMQVALSSSAAAHSRLAASWRRSVEKHGLDPSEHRPPEMIEAATLAERREAQDKFLMVTTPKLDALFALVGNSGCGVLLTDSDGVVLDQRCTDGDADVFKRWGLWQGAVWSEEAEGTNGIGTCLAEGRRVTIHRDEHFYTRNTGMSCMDAPIYDPEGRIMAALDVSSARADQTEGFNRLIGATVAQFAQAIEADYFRAFYSGARIIVAEGEEESEAALLAVDRDDIVLGATRGARKAFGLPMQGKFQPLPARDVLGRDDGPSGFERAERAAVMRALARSGGNVSGAARDLGVGRATLYRRMKRLGMDH